ncbi:hypothetical protein BJ508DRAFT_169768 [Ascobolus immersus RN42]|uniref:Uncharacterized protein n=1 Tax=Ascobolus immersus RN42 TaxID=1160509 RepID=A0A3N4I052_ASCIM|nr:hypothetical protein BJ508DRAFT_169768 [Ascobolus immersus RN42]
MEVEVVEWLTRSPATCLLSSSWACIVSGCLWAREFESRPRRPCLLQELFSGPYLVCFIDLAVFGVQTCAVCRWVAHFSVYFESRPSSYTNNVLSFSLWLQSFGCFSRRSSTRRSSKFGSCR